MKKQIWLQSIDLRRNEHSVLTTLFWKPILQNMVVIYCHWMWPILFIVSHFHEGWSWFTESLLWVKIKFHVYSDIWAKSPYDMQTSKASVVITVCYASFPRMAEVVYLVAFLRQGQIPCLLQHCDTETRIKSPFYRTYCLLWVISTNGGGGLLGRFSPSRSNSMSSSSSFFWNKWECSLPSYDTEIGAKSPLHEDINVKSPVHGYYGSLHYGIDISLSTKIWFHSFHEN